MRDIIEVARILGIEIDIKVQEEEMTGTLEVIIEGRGIHPNGKRSRKRVLMLLVQICPFMEKKNVS
jgi:hypothetical protein